MKLTITAIILIAIVVFSLRTALDPHGDGAVLSSTSPLKSHGQASESKPDRAVRLISIEELQQQANCVLALYGEPTVTVDGKWGPMTDAAYRNAYSLQQAEKLTKDYYDTTR